MPKCCFKVLAVPKMELSTGSCVEIPTEGSATERQNRKIEETGFCRDCIFGGFDASEGDYVCRHH